MSWWSRMLGYLRGEAGGEGAMRNQPAPLAGEPSVFECQACFKVFDSTSPRPSCPECDSGDVKSLTA